MRHRVHMVSPKTPLVKNRNFIFEILIQQVKLNLVLSIIKSLTLLGVLCLAGCAPSVQYSTKTSRCETPTAALDNSAISATVYALNASKSDAIQRLEEVIKNADGNFTCGTYIEANPDRTARGIKVYEINVNSTDYASYEQEILDVLNSTKTSPNRKVAIISTFTDSGNQKVIVEGAGDIQETSAVSPSTQAETSKYYSSLAQSNQTIIAKRIKSVDTNTSTKRRDIYNCADFSSGAAAQAFFESTPGDPNRLDGDNDGIACEVFANISLTWRIATTNSSRNQTRYTSGNSGRCWVNSYTRKDGTRVRGYYRRC